MKEATKLTRQIFDKTYWYIFYSLFVLIKLLCFNICDFKTKLNIDFRTVLGRSLLFDSKRSVKVFELQDAQSWERKYNSLNNDPMFRIVRSLRIIRQEVLQISFERNIGFYIWPRIVWWETREISFMFENYNTFKKLKYRRQTDKLKVYQIIGYKKIIGTKKREKKT